MGGGPGWGQDWVSVNSRLMSEREAESARNAQAPGRGQGHQSPILGTGGRKLGKHSDQDNPSSKSTSFKDCCSVVRESQDIIPQRGFCWPFLMTDSDFYSQPLRLNLCLNVCLVSRVGLGLANEYCIQWECVSQHKYKSKLSIVIVYHGKCRIRWNRWTL